MTKWALLLFSLIPSVGFAQLSTVLTRGTLSVHVVQMPYTSEREPTVIVSVWSSDRDVDAFDISLDYEVAGKKFTKASTVQRVRYSLNSWSGECYWVGEVKVIAVRVKESKPAQEFSMQPAG